MTWGELAGSEEIMYGSRQTSQRLAEWTTSIVNEELNQKRPSRLILITT